jgi:hypothetical protein
MYAVSSTPGPGLPRSNRTEMGPLTEEHRPRVNEPADRRWGPSRVKSGSAEHVAAEAGSTQRADLQVLERSFSRGK